MKIEKPSYYVKLTMENTQYLVLVNGIELERDFDGYSLNLEIPINQFVKDGVNSIGLLVPPEEYHEGEFDPLKAELEVWVKGTIEGKDVEYKLTDIIHTPEIINGRYQHSLKSAPAGTFSYGENNQVVEDDNGQIKVGKISSEYDYLGEYADVLTRSFTAEVDFPEWVLFQGDEITEFPLEGEGYKNTKSLIFPQLKKLQDLFDTRDIEKILKVFEARSAEYDIAFYKEPGTTLKELENSIRNTLESDYPQVIKDENKMQLVVSSDGRVATIVNAGSMNGTIMFDAGDDFVISYNAYWIRKDGEWIIAR